MNKIMQLSTLNLRYSKILHNFGDFVFLVLDMIILKEPFILLNSFNLSLSDLISNLLGKM